MSWNHQTSGFAARPKASCVSARSTMGTHTTRPSVHARDQAYTSDATSIFFGREEPEAAVSNGRRNITDF
jgi:hypothetical protein